MTLPTLPPIPRRPPATTPAPPTYAPVDPAVGRVAFYDLPAADTPGVPQGAVEDRARFEYALPSTYPVTFSWRRAVRALGEGAPMPRSVLDHVYPSPEGQAWLDSLPVSYQVVNLTPHGVNVVGPNRWHTHGDRSPLYIIPTTGQPARLAVYEREVGKSALLDPRAAPQKKFGKIANLPDPAPGVYFLVSMAVARERLSRTDLIAPGAKSAVGITGCEDFVRYV